MSGCGKCMKWLLFSAASFERQELYRVIGAELLLNKLYLWFLPPPSILYFSKSMILAEFVKRLPCWTRFRVPCTAAGGPCICVKMLLVNDVEKFSITLARDSSPINVRTNSPNLELVHCTELHQATFKIRPAGIRVLGGWGRSDACWMLHKSIRGLLEKSIAK